MGRPLVVAEPAALALAGGRVRDRGDVRVAGHVRRNLRWCCPSCGSGDPVARRRPILAPTVTSDADPSRRSVTRAGCRPRRLRRWRRLPSRGATGSDRCPRAPRPVRRGSRRRTRARPRRGSTRPGRRTGPRPVVGTRGARRAGGAVAGSRSFGRSGRPTITSAATRGSSKPSRTATFAPNDHPRTTVGRSGAEARTNVIAARASPTSACPPP